MEIGEQQEDSAGLNTGDKKRGIGTMESGEEQGGEYTVATKPDEHQEEKAIEALVEKEDAVMDSLPVEVETDKLRAEREKAPDNAEERVVHEAAGGLGFPSEKTVRVSDGDKVRDAGQHNVGERNGVEQQVQEKGGAEGHGEDDGQAEVDATMADNDADTEVEMAEAPGEAEGEEQRPAGEQPAGDETNGARMVRVGVKRNGSAALDNTDGAGGEVVVKRPKKKANVWSKSSTRKTSRKSKPVKIPSGEKKEECIEVNPTQRYLLEERNGIQLSKDQKAEKVELSLDKLQASSEKGYRMVRATRGISEGAWYFEIVVKDLGKTGHTRLGWSTWKGDLQAPVGFDANSYAFRDVDGSKVHQAIREPYASAYAEGDVIGFYINLPDGAKYASKYELYVNKATRAVFRVPLEKEDGPPKCVPGSEVSFFKNGVCQGVAYRDIFAGEYYPAASMYTLPMPEKKCSVRFNFGPNFQFPVKDWGDKPVPLPMSQAPPPEGLAAADIEEPPPADGSKESKKSDTANVAGGKQRMAAERGNSSAEGRIAVGVGSGSGVRTKRATDDKERVKRPGLPAKKVPVPKGSKKMISMLPRSIVAKSPAKSPMSDASLQIEVNLEGCSNDGSGDFDAGLSLHDKGNSSDTQTD
ncbi:uncharacterized protein [Physcomitrium patens]|uniref:B30.2/SPRY domain-containing protein n=1 Tax=Physcomitrium patens TaxID=3218 RepID=A0A2K1JQ65_PHYPA|nr:protein TRAUCO-like isoform X1 [Physcomitrium patens]PNR43684.1 hypothetical protein PHYPA_016066 [Physcomitrium patens]|eukprot:XP_024391213.1 protein TRAUCO-like isoform X1 [Physcomitrella patens]